MASGGRLPVSYLAYLKSNRPLAASCPFIRIAIWYPAAVWRFPYFCLYDFFYPLKANWHLAASCQMPVHMNVRTGIWLPLPVFFLP